MKPVLNTRIETMTPVVSPYDLRLEIPVTNTDTDFIYRSRETIANIIQHKDPRLLVIMGPCSIHDAAAAIEYAHKIKEIQEKVDDKIVIIMRVYFEKPRTVIGWKGLINDPDMNESYNISKGLSLARKLLSDITALELPAASEFLDPIIPQYISDLISWAAIGARTTESQTHREMASGLSMPVGFKNGTDGSLSIAINAMQSSQAPHRFLGINGNGITSLVTTQGNSNTHLILRGGSAGPNYSEAHIAKALRELQVNHLPESIIVDCSHDNSGKDAAQQGAVFKEVIRQRLSGRNELIGVMLESNLKEGKQTIPFDITQLQYGVSITDACIGIDETRTLLFDIYNQL